MKKKLLVDLRASGEIKNFRPSPLWVEAFELYRLETKKSLRLGCGSCYQKVLKWLQKP